MEDTSEIIHTEFGEFKLHPYLKCSYCIYEDESMYSKVCVNCRVSLPHGYYPKKQELWKS